MASLAHLSGRLQPTQRELEVGRLLCEGLSNGEIAKRAFIAEQTVKFHLTSLYRKLGAANRTHLLVRLVEEGLATCPCQRSIEHRVVIDGRLYRPADKT